MIRQKIDTKLDKKLNKKLDKKLNKNKQTERKKLNRQKWTKSIQKLDIKQRKNFDEISTKELRYRSINHTQKTLERQLATSFPTKRSRVIEAGKI